MNSKKADLLAKYRQRVDLAIGFRKNEGLDDLWKRMNDLYRGKHFPKALSDQDNIVVNVAFSTINVIGPSVAVNHPKITVTPAAMNMEDQAVIAEAVLNYWWRHYDFTSEFQSAVKDSLIFGCGWLKVGWRYVEDEEYDADAAVADLVERQAQLDDFAAENPQLAGDLPSDEDLEAELDLVSSRTIVKEDRPFVERCSIGDVYVDPEATSPRDMKWIAHKLVKTLDEVRENESYKKKARMSVRPDSHVDSEWDLGGSDWRDSETYDDSEDLARVTVWEFYDLTTNQMCVFPEVGDDYLIDPADIPYSYGHPFVYIPNYDVPDQFYGMGELEALEPLQHELNQTRTAMFNDRKAFRRAWLYNPDRFDHVGKGMLASDQDNRLIPVTGQGDLGSAVVPLPTNTTNPQLYQDSSIIESDIATVTAVSEYQRGNVAEIRRTATEASLIADASNARAADKLAKVEHVIAEIGERLLMLAQEFLDSTQVAKIVRADGTSIVFEFEPEDIEGQFDFEVEGGSTRPSNEQQRKQDAIELLQALAPFAAAGLVNLPALLAYCLKYGFDVKNPERFLQMPQIDPMTGQPMPPGMGAPGVGAAPPPPTGVFPDAGMEDGGVPPGVPPEVAAQLAGQVGLNLGG